MMFTKLRLTGFKSFVEPSEMLIESGLTGIVGPNGCGKSNLLEAMRWAMGESSFKSMRASAMDDVIFSGTRNRPPRNMAEVTLFLDNSGRIAPAVFNDSDTLEITRRIERGQGSAYRINGREARARDVQLLFADASTGARSPSLVRQGQISELINAKPQARRRILEEAAGITGLYTRRHEAELKLSAAEHNLVRLDDVIGQLESQLDGLRRQARQAKRYRELSARIRRLEAAQLYRAWAEAVAAVEMEQRALKELARRLAEETLNISRAERAKEEADSALPKLRETEAVRGAIVQRLAQERDILETEERSGLARRKDLSAQLAQADKDLERENELIADSAKTLERLAREEADLNAASAGDADTRGEAARRLQIAADNLAVAQEAADKAAANLSALSARRAALEQTATDQGKRIERLERQIDGVEEERSKLAGQDALADEAAALNVSLERATAAVEAAEAQAAGAEAAVASARAEEAKTRSIFDEARRVADRLETEIDTLSKLLVEDDEHAWPRLLDAVSVEPGYERALAAAFGGDLEASTDNAAPAYWAGLDPLDEGVSLPAGTEPLSARVVGPDLLRRRLSFIGVVAEEYGARLQAQLKPGQRLVSKAGALWRWDGFTVAADAPSAAAQRLAERNRLELLRERLDGAKAEMAGTAQLHTAACARVEILGEAERSARQGVREARAVVEQARADVAAHERRLGEISARVTALDEALRRLREDVDEAVSTRAAAQQGLAECAPVDVLTSELDRLRTVAGELRAVHSDARVHHDGLEREARGRAERMRAIADECRSWQERSARAAGQIANLQERRTRLSEEIRGLEDFPERIEARRRKLLTSLQQAESERAAASDALAAGEATARQCEQELRVIRGALAEIREDQARHEALRESAASRVEAAERRIAEELGVEPHSALVATGVETIDELPDPGEIIQTLSALKSDRERLGSVNLRADEEAEEIAQRIAELVTERDDVIQAVQRLRQGIINLNREGRARLLEAFEKVNANFATLFTTLFDGGRAELTLVEADDPLEAGLEIIANPPGKRPQVLSLLSGGEQALTAIALIFAVFLTNPSPICVLDEVDAPLDDANVERFCNLLDAMLGRSQTRFLIITHNAYTMARMHRLFGVTMMERGVSQLVSVDLEQAESLREAS